MGYLFGDSTEAGLEFNYLAFLREAVDCAVAMVECDVSVAAIADRKRDREREMEAELAAVADLAKRASDVVSGSAKDATAVGRCAAAIATAIRDAAERESAAVRAKLAGQRDELDKDGQAINARAKDALEKLLRAHDLPGAEKELAVTWTTSGVAATLRQRTGFGVEAVLALDIPPSSIFTQDLRVERVADGIEVHAREAGGWLKKGDKLVTHKLARYRVVSITIGATVRIQLRADANAGEMTIIAPPNGDLMIDASGGGSTPREITIDERDRPRLQSFVDKIEAATRALDEARSRLVSIDIDHKSFAEPGNPRLFAERLTAAMAPTVHKIKQHSRNADELVLRRLLGDNRREEMFVPIAELVARFAVLPAHARGVFAPLQLQGEPPALAGAMVERVTAKVNDDKPSDGKPSEGKPSDGKPSDGKPVEIKPTDVKPSDGKPVEVRPIEAKPTDDRAFESKPADVKLPSVPMPDRSGSRTSPPIVTERSASRTSPPVMTDRPAGRTSPPANVEPLTTRKKEPTQPFGTALADSQRVPAPPPPSADSGDEDEWPAIAREEPTDSSS